MLLDVLEMIFLFLPINYLALGWDLERHAFFAYTIKNKGKKKEKKTSHIPQPVMVVGAFDSFINFAYPVYSME